MKSWEIAVLAVVVVVVAAGGAWYAMSTYRPTTAPTTPITYTVALTDPPVVPEGTTDLLINYSGVAVHTTEGGWVSNATATGTVNLLGLQNLSFVIANVNVSREATVNIVRLYISNATIVVNGTSYPLMLPSGELTIPITNATRAAPGALVDLQPHVIEAYVGDQPVFIMAPAAVAVPLNYTAPPGTVMHVPKNVRKALERAGANVTVTSATLQVVGNETILSVTVKNEGSTPVEVLGMDVKGPWSVEVPPFTIETKGFSATINVEGARANMSLVFFANGTQLVPAVQRASEHMHVNWVLPPRAKAKWMGVEWSGNEDEFHKEMGRWANYMGGGNPPEMTIRGPNGSFNFTGGKAFNFTAPAPLTNGYNATFSGAPYAEEWPNALGYTLQPGASVTFTYEGVITLGPHLEDSPVGPVNITIIPVSGEGYTISVLTIPASNATATTTAS